MPKRDGMCFTEASTLEDLLALEETTRANTVEYKLNPKLARHVPWPECMVLMTKETCCVRRVAEICHDTVIDMDGAFVSHVAQRQHRSVPDSPALPTAAPAPDIRQESARDKTVLANIPKAHSAHDKCQRDAKIAKSMECSTTQGCTIERDLKTALVRGEKLDQELMSLEPVALKSDPLSDDDVLRAASTANGLAELVKNARALASALRNSFKLKTSTQAWRATRAQQQL